MWNVRYYFKENENFMNMNRSDNNIQSMEIAKFNQTAKKDIFTWIEYYPKIELKFPNRKIIPSKCTIKVL